MPLPALAILEVGAKLIEKFIPDPSKQAAAKLALLDLQQRGELAQLTASATVIEAEAKSEHLLTSTWRPITMLVMVAIIANNYILAPYLSALFGFNVVLEIPPDMWGLLKLGIGGYVMGRSVEKAVTIYKAPTPQKSEPRNENGFD